jgi:hypothetical protein
VQDDAGQSVDRVVDKKKIVYKTDGRGVADPKNGLILFVSEGVIQHRTTLNSFFV